ncbi:GNAT family N-acetyltransferase [Labrys sp. LIt4]|uniref:GNAT family N-acetyltransferase n=1 Tax=Labrys sp. LIt4 TaxID=2821355 RepID=UPI001ADF81D6|nr:GNAT family N-acetyltransferase [Labrys sp. LIt4]MBP0582511.1 GNAT family N-acetyltransferase [Labrys sp. LIt4]
MPVNHDIRRANPNDAAAISEIILAALWETNARDYGPEIIEQVERSFTPPQVEELIRKREVLVALVDGRVTGTASLEGEWVRTVFVIPEAQGTGIGRRLMAEIEDLARRAGLVTLRVPSTVTAERFYNKLGFKAVRDSYYGDERTIIMEKHLFAR